MCFLPISSMGNRPLSIKDQELSVLVTDIFNAHLATRGEGDVDTVTLPQLDKITTDVDLDRSASSGTSIVAGPLNEVCVNVSAPGSVGKGGGRREDGSEDVERRMDWGRTCGFALIDDLLTVPDSWCDNMRPFILLVSVGEMSK